MFAIEISADGVQSYPRIYKFSSAWPQYWEYHSHNRIRDLQKHLVRQTLNVRPFFIRLLATTQHHNFCNNGSYSINATAYSPAKCISSCLVVLLLIIE